jgi:type 1 fimbria pilin
MKTSRAARRTDCSAPPPLAHADSATITVTGKVLPGTCTMANVPVALADIDATDLKAGHDNGLTPAVLNFTGCVGVPASISFDGTEDSARMGTG